MSESTKKHDRVLELYSRLLTGEVLHKDKLALEYGVTTARSNAILTPSVIFAPIRQPDMAKRLMLFMTVLLADSG